jgi:hypothetical protein
MKARVRSQSCANYSPPRSVFVVVMTSQSGGSVLLRPRDQRAVRSNPLGSAELLPRVRGINSVTKVNCSIELDRIRARCVGPRYAGTIVYCAVVRRPCGSGSCSAGSIKRHGIEPEQAAAEIASRMCQSDARGSDDFARRSSPSLRSGSRRQSRANVCGHRCGALADVLGPRTSFPADRHGRTVSIVHGALDTRVWNFR